MNTGRKIAFLVAVAGLSLLAAVPVRAQELSERSYGTVIEQIQNSKLYVDPYEEFRYLTDYSAVLRGTILEPVERPVEEESTIDAVIADLLDFAATFKGTRYRSGSASPKGFDCSGFTSYVFAHFGYNLNRTSRGQVANGDPVESDDLRPGDLVFFNGRQVGTRVGHVGIVTEVDSVDGTFNFIHSCNSLGVTVSGSEEPYYKKRYMGACRPIKEEE